MKKVIAAGLLLLAFLLSLPVPAQEKGKGHKDHKEHPDKQDKEKKEDNARKNDGDKGSGKDKDKGTHGQDKNGKKEEGKPGKDDDATGEKSEKEDKDWKKNGSRKWTRETFKERGKWKNAEKVIVCHKVNRNDGEAPVTLSVSVNALDAHLAHGDVTGQCPENTATRYSEEVIRTRNTYYKVLQENYEQAVYSRSVLDYALLRLEEARRDLLALEAARVPVVTIQVRRDAVTELEANVNALRVLLDTAEDLVDWAT